MLLSASDLDELSTLRKHFHRHPELSGEEVQTAQTISDKLKALSPTRVITQLGGHGVAAVFDSGVAGPTVMFRAELDALPIQEQSDNEWASTVPGKSHMCGHDGHMMFLIALAKLLRSKPAEKGRVVLMFQPSEEDGTGARAVVADAAYHDIIPDYAFAIHLEPGLPFGYVATRAGLINCASHGLQIKLTGQTAHAADPEDGVSPAMAIVKLLPKLNELGDGGKLDDHFRMATITHVQIGEAR